MRAAALALLVSAASASAATVPAPVLDSDLTLRIEPVGKAVSDSTANNLQSPVVIGGQLYVVDQRAGILVQDGISVRPALTAADAPAGITPSGNEAFVNMAAGPGRVVYVAFTSSTLPPGLTARPLPDNPLFGDPQNYQVIVKYRLNDRGRFKRPVPLAAFQTATGGHRGGGMLTLPDGRLLYATGDNLGFDRDGLGAPQRNRQQTGKLLIIDRNGAVELAAKGVRNVQHLAYADAGKTKIVFADFGSTTADEINSVDVAALTNTRRIENFGWGRNADGLAREGTFYITDGATSNPGTQPVAIGEAPRPEAGFIQPYAQIGREGAAGFGISGPVTSDLSFGSIAALFGDLVGGGLFATTAAFDGQQVDVFRVSLVDLFGESVSLLDLSASSRADVRFFNFADGGAGLLLESTGGLYRLTQFETMAASGAREAAPVPAPATLPLLLLALCGGAVVRFGRRPQASR
jgi:hypothetical protein